MFDLIITANSPGEVAGWVEPVVKKVKQVYSNVRISIFLTPCVFASGSEQEVLNNYSEVDRVYNWKEYLKYIVLQKKPDNFNPGNRGLVFFLGGDLFHAVLLGKKLDYPVIAYSQGAYSRSNYIKKFLVPDQRVRNKLLDKGAQADKVEIVGNLMFDAIEPEMNLQETKEFLNINNEKIITLFPGSRLKQLEYMLPFFLNSLIRFTSNRKEEFKIFLSQSPFITREQLKKVFLKYISNNSLEGKIINKDNYILIEIFDKLKINIYKGLNYSLMQVTDLALTIPGTNNLELAYFGAPMLVVLPLNQPSRIPLRGLKGLIGRLPFIGPLLKKLVIPHLLDNREFISLPNIINDQEIVPELIGELSFQDLTDKIGELIDDKDYLQEMKNKLKQTTSNHLPSQKILDNINQVLKMEVYNG